jgi:hypothetical protein
MSDNQQTPSNVGRALILVIAVIVAGTVWFVFQSRNEADKTLEDTKKAQSTDESDTKTDEYKGWESYTWASQGVNFKHPADWVTEENTGIGRLYVKNQDVNLLTEETPDNFQQIWLSIDTDESSAAREDAIKNGTSAFRTVNGEVKASTLEAGDITINTYEYETTGGPTMEAYWTGKDGKRLFATNSTDVGEQNQTEMVATLKKVLASVAQAE